MTWPLEGLLELLTVKVKLCSDRTCEEEGKLIVSIDVSLEYLPPIREQIVMMSFENKESSFDLIEIKEEIKKNEAVVDQIANRKLIHYEFNGVNGNHFYTSDVLEKGKYLLELSGCIIDPNYGCYD